MATLLYQQSNVEIFWEDRDQWLQVNWTGLQSPVEVQRDCEQLLRLLAAKNANSVLNDTSRVDGIWIGSADWGADWFHRMRQSGLKYFAAVSSENRTSHGTTGTPLDAAAAGTAKAFFSVEEAANWLRTQRRRDSARTQRIVLPPNLGRS
ncbi:MAG: hypothetical protein EOP84_34415 [Verrucomicrobiaceae bacterium]|nr:MAG: hypothetical protein EOP84_34415 [Verrucomicrobiaceae bacterium]